jgi:hypothetical protein
MRLIAVTAAVLAVFAVQAGPAGAATKKGHSNPPIMRTASGTVIEPTKTIIHRPDGTTTVIVIPRRSYLDTGTEVSVGDRSFRDYAFAPGGDPGRSNWTMGGPDLSGNGNYLPTVGPLYLPGFNPATPF